MTAEIRELLEMAAKAVGYTQIGMPEDGGSECVLADGGTWDPADDDGDSRRLEVALRMEVIRDEPEDQIRWVSVRAYGCRGWSVEEFEDESQSAAAMRLAVLKSAAAVGRAMP